jgi:hypothetical protein
LVVVVLEIAATPQAEQTEATQYSQPLHLLAAAAVQQQVTINPFLVMEVQVVVQVQLVQDLEPLELEQPIKVFQVVKVWGQTLIYQVQAVEQARLRPILPQAENQVEQV